jgi:RNA polymerase sigma-70 factor (ECF subfamily)
MPRCRRRSAGLNGPNCVPPSQAKALQLARIEELSLSEASARSGFSVGALKVATHCALNTLRKRLSAP